ncbi:MAG: orotidine 5'-phosphate decarboxylase [Candidatus Kapaibacterium sp.]|nr:MAG: orotidine 5'-phosphate decarboxylase [Candidatus Kapabacteria bacterium]
MTAREKLSAALQAVGSYLCIGIDLHARYVRGRSAQALIEWVEPIVEVGRSRCIAFKINLAFIEALGVEGWSMLERLVHLVPDDRLLIFDGKRGDIGSTAEAYAAAAFERFGADAVTVNPYMGRDAIEPFTAYADKLTFALALTSNDGARDLQLVNCDGAPIYQRVIESLLAIPWQDRLGFVVGATHPEQLSHVRHCVGRDCPLLIPGVGSQGGEIEAVRSANAGGVAAVNVSRGILDAYWDGGVEGLRAAVEQYSRLLAVI